MSNSIRKLQPTSQDAFKLALQHSVDAWESELENAERNNRTADAEWCRYMLRLRQYREDPIEFKMASDDKPPKWAVAIGSLFCAPIFAIASAIFAIVSIVLWPFAPLLVWAFYKPTPLKSKPHTTK